LQRWTSATNHGGIWGNIDLSGENVLHSASYTSIFENPEIKMKPGEFWLMLLSPTSIQVVLILAVHKTYRNGLRPLPVLPLRNVEAFTYRPFE
jgi:hypothetical protein